LTGTQIIRLAQNSIQHEIGTGSQEPIYDLPPSKLEWCTRNTIYTKSSSNMYLSNTDLLICGKTYTNNYLLNVEKFNIQSSSGHSPGPLKLMHPNVEVMPLPPNTKSSFNLGIMELSKHLSLIIINKQYQSI
jgi:hypothetical protein